MQGGIPQSTVLLELRASLESDSTRLTLPSKGDHPLGESLDLVDYSTTIVKKAMHTKEDVGNIEWFHNFIIDTQRIKGVDGLAGDQYKPDSRVVLN